MSIRDRLTDWLDRRQQQREVEEVEQETIVWNRETRRRHGIRVPVGLITEQHVGLTVPEESTLPRYVRRHFAAMTGPRTRRNRKATARIMRMLTAAGRV